MNNIKSRNKIIQDLEKVFQFAFDNNDLKSAIKAKEVIAKIQGFISKSKEKKEKLSLIELSPQEIDALINQAKDLHS